MYACVCCTCCFHIMYVYGNLWHPCCFPITHLSVKPSSVVFVSCTYMLFSYHACVYKTLFTHVNVCCHCCFHITPVYVKHGCSTAFQIMHVYAVPCCLVVFIPCKCIKNHVYFISCIYMWILVVFIPSISMWYLLVIVLFVPSMCMWNLVVFIVLISWVFR